MKPRLRKELERDNAELRKQVLRLSAGLTEAIDSVTRFQDGYCWQQGRRYEDQACIAIIKSLRRYQQEKL